MHWRQLKTPAKRYLVGVYVVGAVLAIGSFLSSSNRFTSDWLYLTFASLFVATVSVRLPKTTSVVISMGDVLTILALMHFGPGPALVTYWFQMVIGNVSDLYRKYGLSLTEEIYSYKFSFNFANCALSMWCMHLAFAFVETLAARGRSGVL